MRIMKGNTESSPPAPAAGDSPTQRSHDWFVCSGAQRLALASAVSYDEYARRARERTAVPETFGEDLAQIELDLERILPSLGEFLLPDGTCSEQDEEAVAQSPEYFALVVKLRNVLTAYSVRNARVGYVQGHADLLCFVLAHTRDRIEEQAFWIYATVVERIFPEDFFARSPKLHGFHIDVKMFEELMAQRLVPHVPELANVDLSFLASLLGCKWFVPVWVGELPHSLLANLWEAILFGDDGTYLHLLLSLHFVRLACNSISSKGEFAQWDASFVYKEVLSACRTFKPTSSLVDILGQAKAVHNLSDEGIEDWRADLRGQAPFLAKETSTLMETVHFQRSEIARLYDEFRFARSYLKNCERMHLRGLRREFVDDLLSREFPMIPLDVSKRMVDLLRRDAYGNISFFRLLQLISVLQRGTQEERAMLLFSAVDKRHCLRLNSYEIGEFADILCNLAVHQILHRDEAALSFRELTEERQTKRSPLLRAHFLSLLVEVSGGSKDSLSHSSWLKGVISYPDILALLSPWSSFDISDRRSELSGITRLRRSGSSSALGNFAQVVSLARTSRERGSTSARRTKGTTTGVRSDRSRTPTEPLSQDQSAIEPSFSLLSGQMRKKYMTAQQRSRSSLSKDSRDELSLRASERVFWCECTIA